MSGGRLCFPRNNREFFFVTNRNSTVPDTHIPTFVQDAPAIDYVIDITAANGVPHKEGMRCSKYWTDASVLAKHDGVSRPFQKGRHHTLDLDCNDQPLSPETVYEMVRKMKYHGMLNIGYRAPYNGGAIIFDINPRVSANVAQTKRFSDEIVWVAKQISA